MCCGFFVTLGVVACAACDSSDEGQASGRCEGSAYVVRDATGVETARMDCAADEVCILLGKSFFVCRLPLLCADAELGCHGDDLYVCDSSIPSDVQVKRVRCSAANHGRVGDLRYPSPGRCEPSSGAAGARCVDADAVGCVARGDVCDGPDRIACSDSLTSRERVCSEAAQVRGAMCRVNAEGRGVCALPGASSCAYPTARTCSADAMAIETCRDGFSWVDPCEPGTRCRSVVQGDLALEECAP